jgi:hypothetical protein
MFVSQPSETLPLQLANPGLHAVMVQNPLTHAADAFGGAHTAPQAPQLLVLVAMFVSHPFAAMWSQSAKPAAQTSWHVPFTQEAVAFGPEAQTWPQAPQLLMLVLMFVSQPSVALLLQSAKPGEQTKLHWLFTHVAVAFAGGEQTLPQAPQLFGSFDVVTQTVVVQAVSPFEQCLGGGAAFALPALVRVAAAPPKRPPASTAPKRPSICLRVDVP